MFDDIHAGLRANEVQLLRWRPTRSAATEASEPELDCSAPPSSRRHPPPTRLRISPPAKADLLSVTDDESEIEASRAPLLEHLVELRRRLIVCAVALVVGFLLCFAFSAADLHPAAAPVRGRRRPAGGAESARRPPRPVRPAADPDRPAARAARARAAAAGVHRAAGVLLHQGEAGGVRGHRRDLPGAGLAALPLRRAGPLQARAQRLPAVPDRLAGAVPHGRGAGLFRHAAVRAVVLAEPADRRRGQCLGRSCCPRCPTISTWSPPCCWPSASASSCRWCWRCWAWPGWSAPRCCAAGRRYAIVGVFVVAAIVTPPDPISMISPRPCRSACSTRSRSGASR